MSVGFFLRCRIARLRKRADKIRSKGGSRLLADWCDIEADRLEAGDRP